ncbi:MAG: conserved exported protein of unknown function [Nitrospira sp.]|nr:hypothetical protein [Nitrospira sp.]ULA61866.1 MAG: conserved exported protein of unknown function [Nitrospira sp.]
MKPTIALLTALSLTTSLLLGGCASFRDDNRTSITEWPLKAGEKKPSVNLFVTGQAWVNDDQIPADKVQSNFLGQWRTQAGKAFEESGLFSEVKLGEDEPTDVRVDIAIHMHGEYSQTLSFLLGFTFGLSSLVVPQKSTAAFSVTATFTERDGRSLGEFKQSETVATWVQLFLLFAMPFREGLQATETQVVYDLHRAILQESQHKHVLSGPSIVSAPGPSSSSPLTQ